MSNPNPPTEFFQRLIAGFADLDELIKFARLARKAGDSPDTTAERELGILPDVTDFQLAVKRLVFPSLFTAEFVLVQHNRADWQSVDVRIQRFAATMVDRFRSIGVPLYVHCAFRTVGQQAVLVASGKSRVKGPRAPHCQGVAVDIVHSKFHWELSRTEWGILGAYGKQVASSLGLKVVWGGDWDFFDPAHWELEGWRSSMHDVVVGDPVHRTPSAILSAFR